MHSLKTRSQLVGIGICLCLFVTACSTTAELQYKATGPYPETKIATSPEAKNIILFIGDGMGVSTVTAIRILDGQQKGLPGEDNILSFEKFPHVALSKTYEVDQQVGESGGTATAMMTGQKTNAGFIGISSEAQRKNCASSKGKHLPSALELAESKGKSTGVVTTTRLTHATPAAAYAHVPERDWENDRNLTDEARRHGCTDIAAQLIEFPYGDGIDVALGGGRIKFLPNNMVDPEGADNEEGRQDDRDLTQEWLRKYPNSAYIWNQQQFDSINPGSTDHLLGLFESEHMQYEADRLQDTGGEPSLAQMTKLAIEILSRNSNGYFLLVEGGRIDHGHHDNNAYRALTDGIAFADAVTVADEMTDKNDTLIIVTADHSHTFNFSGYPTRGNPILGKVNSGSQIQLMDDEKPFTTVGYYVGPGAAWVGGPRPDISETDTVNDKNYIQQAAIPAEDDTHGGEDVAVYARGPGAEYIHGVMEQNEIFDAMDKALDLTGSAVD